MREDRRMHYWLVKTEPDTYSLADLERDGVGRWDGIRGYAARNNLRAMEEGDGVLIYHSSTKVPAIVGRAVVVRTAYPDPTQFQKRSSYYDEKSKRDDPRWSAVDLRFVESFKKPLPLAELRARAPFCDMVVAGKETRLSVQPVSKMHFMRVLKQCGSTT